MPVRLGIPGEDPKKKIKKIKEKLTKGGKKPKEKNDKDK